MWLNAENPSLDGEWGRDDVGGLLVPEADPRARTKAALLRVSRTRAKTLLILDNVTEWSSKSKPGPLPQGGHIRKLITTRQRELGGAAFIQHDLDFLRPEDARRLLARGFPQRDRARGRRFAQAPEWPRARARALQVPICEDSRLKLPRGYLASLLERAPVEDEAAEATTYEATTTAALRAIWDASDAVRAAWCVAAAFADADAGAELSDECGLDAKALRELRKWHLIRFDADNRWSMHRLVRQYGRHDVSEKAAREGLHQFVSGCASFREQD